MDTLDVSRRDGGHVRKEHGAAIGRVFRKGGGWRPCWGGAGMSHLGRVSRGGEEKAPGWEWRGGRMGTVSIGNRGGDGVEGRFSAAAP